MQLFNLVAIYARPVKPVQETSNLIPDSVTKPNLYAEDANPDKSYQDLLQPDEISTVIIALRILTQPSFIEAALSAGKHVLAKKSTAKDAAATRIIIANARRICSTSNAAFAVAENIRFCHSFAYAAREAAELGKVHTFSVRVLWHIEPDNKWLNTAAWRQKPDYQGGFLFDDGVHWAAATRLLLAGEDSKSEAVRDLRRKCASACRRLILSTPSSKPSLG